MHIVLTIFGTAFLFMAVIGALFPMPDWLLPAGAAVFCGFLLLGFGELLRRIGKGKS